MRDVSTLNESIVTPESEACQSPLIKAALDMGWRITSVVRQGQRDGTSVARPEPARVTRQREPDLQRSPWACPLSVNVPTRKIGDFRSYVNRLRSRVIVLGSRGDPGTVKVISPADSSRYFPEGRRRIRGRVARRMGGFWSANGILLTLTFAPAQVSCEEAWRRVGEARRQYLKELNRWRQRQGYRAARYVCVVEIQPGTGYPHIHVAFPRLRWLAPLPVLISLWSWSEPQGVDISYRDGFSPAGYVLKYIAKMDEWSDEGMAELWANRTRLYSMSRDFYVVPDEKRTPEWVFLRSAKVAYARWWLPELVERYDTVLGCNELAKEVFIGSGKG